MPAKKQIEKALIESLEKWNETVKKFRTSIEDKSKWFYKHCWSHTCPLCELLPDPEDCAYCPISDEDLPCCAEWSIARDKAIKEKLALEHLQAVRDRIKRECEKRGLLKGDASE